MAVIHPKKHIPVVIPKQFCYLLLGAAAVPALPFAARQRTKEVSRDLPDFAMMGALLRAAAAILQLMLQNIRSACAQVI